jgi:phosphatidylglycerophosphate synthase
VAIEGGKKSSVGALYNEVPDRIADSLFLVAMGYALGTPWLGWLAALAAAVTAYIRVLGGTLGLGQDFRGPMAKPHRMAALTLGCLLSIAEYYWFPAEGEQRLLAAAAVAIAFGAVATCFTRLYAMARQLRARA